MRTTGTRSISEIETIFDESAALIFKRSQARSSRAMLLSSGTVTLRAPLSDGDTDRTTLATSFSFGSRISMLSVWLLAVPGSLGTLTSSEPLRKTAASSLSSANTSLRGATVSRKVAIAMQINTSAVLDHLFSFANLIGHTSADDLHSRASKLFDQRTFSYGALVEGLLLRAARQ